MREKIPTLIYGDLFIAAVVHVACLNGSIGKSLDQISVALYDYFIWNGKENKRNDKGSYIISSEKSVDVTIREILDAINVGSFISPFVEKDEIPKFYDMVIKIYKLYADADTQSCGTCTHHTSGTRVMSCKYCKVSSMENNYEEDRKKLTDGRIICKSRCPHGIDVCCKVCGVYQNSETRCADVCDTYMQYLQQLSLEDDGNPNITFECQRAIIK